VIDITWLRQSDHRVNQKTSINLIRSPLGQLLVDAVHWIPCLEGHHVVIPKGSQEFSGLGRRHPQINKVMVFW
jgi:hypothetical protein